MPVPTMDRLLRRGNGSELIDFGAMLACMTAALQALCRCTIGHVDVGGGLALWDEAR